MRGIRLCFYNGHKANPKLTLTNTSFGLPLLWVSKISPVIAILPSIFAHSYQIAERDFFFFFLKEVECDLTHLKVCLITRVFEHTT